MGIKVVRPKFWYDFRVAQSLEYSHMVIVRKWEQRRRPKKSETDLRYFYPTAQTEHARDLKFGMVGP